MGRRGGVRWGGGEAGGVVRPAGVCARLGQPCRHPPRDTGAITVHLTYPATTPLLP